MEANKKHISQKSKNSSENIACATKNVAGLTFINPLSASVALI